MPHEDESDLVASHLALCSTEELLVEMQLRCKSLVFISLMPDQIIGNISGIPIYDTKRVGVLQWENEGVKAALINELQNALILIEKGD